LNTIAQIATATQGDASFGLVVYGRLNSADASINSIRAQIAGVSAAQDPSINQLISYNSSQDALINSMLVKADFDTSMNANYYTRANVDSSLNSGFYNKATTDLSLGRYLLKTAFDSSLNANYYSKAAIDSSLNTNFYNKTRVDSSLNLRVMKTDFDASMSANYYSRSAVDASLNAWYYNKTSVDNLANVRVLKTDFDASLNTNYYDKASVDAGFYTKTTIDSSLNDGFYNKTMIDGSLNTNFFNKTAINTTLGSYLLKTSFDNSMNTNYYNKSRIDSSFNSIISNYSTINYVDGRFTTLTGVAPSQLDTLAEIAAALQGDASFGMTVYAKITSTDASVNIIRSNLAGYVTSNDFSVNTIRTNLAGTDSSVNTIRTNLAGTDSSVNTIRTNLAGTDSSVNTIRTNLSGYVTSNDSSVNTIRTNLSGYVTSNDSSVNTIRTNLSGYVTSNDSSVNTIRTNLSGYVTSNDASLSAIRASIQQVSSTGAIQDPSINQLIVYNTVQDTSINLLPSKTAIDNSLNNYLLKTSFDSSMNANYYTKTVIDSSLANYALTSSLSSYATTASLSSYSTKTVIDASLANYSTKTVIDASLANYSTKTVIDASLANYSTKTVIDASLANYLQNNLTSDISLNGNVQLGNGSKTISINKTPNALYSLDVSGSAYFTNNIDMSGAVNAMGFYINGDIFDSASDGLSTDSYSTLTALETVVYPFSGSYNTIVTSSDGKYITATSYGGNAAFSNNYGSTFTDISNSVLGTFKFQPAMSSTGQYQYLAANGTNYRTSDYGVTWAIDSTSSFTTAVSGSGKYVLKYLSGTTMNISSNFGSTYAGVDIGAGLTNIRTCAMSKTGQIMAIGSNGGYGVKLSQNFGKTWNMISTGATVFSISISASGRYILAGSYLSNNFGISFEALPAPANITSNICGTTMSANGQYMAISNTTTGFYSLDYGKNWVQRASNGSNVTNGTSMAMTSNGSIIYQATSTGVIRLSASETMVANSLYVTNNIDMSGSINAYGIFNNGDVFDSASDGLSTNRYTNFFTAETQIPVPNVLQCQQVLTSTDGKYITIVSYVNGVSTSNNYGATFTDISNIVGNINKFQAVMSDTGQYQYLSANGPPWKTTDYGTTWVSDAYGSTYAAISGSGKYVLKRADAFSVNLSSDFGQTYASIRLNATGVGISSMGMSKSGQLMIVSCYAGLIQISRNFGKTWSNITNIPTLVTRYALSASGKYILAGNSLSKNFGISFDALPSPASSITNSNVSGFAVSPNGQYMILASATVACYSTDYGQTWTSRANNGTSAGGGVAMPSNSEYILQVTSNGLFKYTNYTDRDISLNLVLGNTASTSTLNNYYTKTVIDASLALYSTKTAIDASLALYSIKTVIDASLANYALTSSLSSYATTASLSSYTLKTTVDASLAFYSTKSIIDTSLNLYLRSGQTSDASLNGNVQLGDGARFMGINKLPNALFALDISGSTNMSGNLSLTKAASVPMGSFDLSAVNMSVFNVSEKFTTVALSATPTLDYSTGGIFYMPGVNGALSTISITNVPTTLNRSISVTLILAQTGNAGTFCFTTGTLNVNGSAITYLKPDATALAAPSANRSVIINQFIIIWNSATPTVIAYLSSMG